MEEIKPERTILMVALPRHDGAYASTSFSLASELSTRATVFYIENPFTIADYGLNFFHPAIRRRKGLGFFRDVYFRKSKNLIVVTPRLIFPINWIPKGVLYTLFSRINDAIIFKSIKKIIRDIGNDKFIYINSFNPLFGSNFPSTFKPEIKIYHCVDDISQSDYISRHGVYLEEQTIKHSDLTIVTSSELKRLKSNWSDRVILLPNAANTQLFQQAVNPIGEVPPEIKQFPVSAKIIGYIGNICSRIDTELLGKIANEHADKIILMIGPVTPDFRSKFTMESFNNVIFVGRMELTELPKYLAFCGCCIIPFLKNKLTKSIYPLKINEYLSAGKPVVTTSFSADIEAFKEVVYLAGDQLEFSQMILKAFEEDSIELRNKRIAFSSKNDWKFRAGEFWDILKRYETEKRST